MHAANSSALYGHEGGQKNKQNGDYAMHVLNKHENGPCGFGSFHKGFVAGDFSAHHVRERCMLSLSLSLSHTSHTPNQPLTHPHQKTSFAHKPLGMLQNSKRDPPCLPTIAIFSNEAKPEKYLAPIPWCAHTAAKHPGPFEFRHGPVSRKSLQIFAGREGGGGQCITTVHAAAFFFEVTREAELGGLPTKRPVLRQRSSAGVRTKFDGSQDGNIRTCG